MSFDEGFTRREFLKGAGALGAVSMTMWLGGCEACQEQIAHRPTRRNIANLSANDPIITAYKNAVTAMKALPSTDPRNWTKQAQIHFNHCPHGNWWFLPWHRAYLSYFERICRKLSGYDDFALPYWNWTTSPSIPAVFWGNGNPLFDNTRLVGPNDQADPAWVGATVIQNILSTANFSIFASYPSSAPRGGTGGGYGELEATPHNNIHGWIGGDMGAFMSPLDPVFWCHHNILDCLWVEWNINRGNPNTNDQNWYNLHMTEFVDENGQPVDVTAAVTVLMPLFSYQFEPCGPAQEAPKKWKRAELEAFLKSGAPVRIDITQRVELQRAITTEVGKPFSSMAQVPAESLKTVLQSQGNTAALLTIDGAQVPQKTDFYVRVFTDKPDASADTPMSDPHYAGSFGFFQDATAMPGMQVMGGEAKQLGFVVDLTPTLKRLSEAGGVQGPAVNITLVPVAYEKRQATGQTLTIEKLEFAIANVK